MGGSGGKKQKKPSVQHAAPLDFNALMRSANEQAAASARAQVQAQIEAYPQLEALQLGTIQRIADNLNNPYTQAARGDINRVSGLGNMLADRVGETTIERTLREQAETELGLGRSLSAEETRDAQQSARAAFAARGLGTSMGSSAAEILNRDSAAQAREASRRNFASATNQMVTGNVFGRAGQAGGMLGSAAQGQLMVDPYERALGRAGIGGQLGANLQSSMGSTFGNAAQMAGGVSTFNANMLDQRANQQMNNWAAMEAARMGSNASRQAGMMGMFGNALQGGIQAGGMIGAAQMAPMMFSDKRMKKDIKPLGKAGSVLGLTAYEYKYKGDDEKRVGFMAQDVKRVLPEAVAEVDYKGKKRLAIKPAVIGAALAEELMAAKAA
jgi:hypothetical protein